MSSIFPIGIILLISEQTFTDSHTSECSFETTGTHQHYGPYIPPQLQPPVPHGSSLPRSKFVSRSTSSLIFCGVATSADPEGDLVGTPGNFGTAFWYTKLVGSHFGVTRCQGWDVNTLLTPAIELQTNSVEFADPPGRLRLLGRPISRFLLMYLGVQGIRGPAGQPPAPFHVAFRWLPENSRGLPGPFLCLRVPG